MATAPGTSTTSQPQPAVLPRSAQLGGKHWSEIAAVQDGVISMDVALASGLTRSEIRSRLASGRWQRPMRGVLVAHAGLMSRRQELWCAVEAVGRPAFLAGPTAAELDGLVGFPSGRIFVVVPPGREAGRRPGITVHRSTILDDDDVRPLRQPPRTSLDRSVLDMASWASSDDTARAVVTAAVQQGLTTVDLLRAVLERVGAGRRSALVAITLDGIEGCVRAVPQLAHRRL